MSRVDDSGPPLFISPISWTRQETPCTASRGGVVVLTPKFRALENVLERSRGSDSLSRYAIRKWKSVLENWCNVLLLSLSLSLILQRRRRTSCKGLESGEQGTSREAASLVWNLISSTDGNALSYSGSPLSLIAFSWRTQPRDSKGLLENRVNWWYWEF